MKKVKLLLVATGLVASLDSQAGRSTAVRKYLAEEHGVTTTEADVGLTAAQLREKMTAEVKAAVRAAADDAAIAEADAATAAGTGDIAVADAARVRARAARDVAHARGAKLARDPSIGRHMARADGSVVAVDGHHTTAVAAHAAALAAPVVVPAPAPAMAGAGGPTVVAKVPVKFDEVGVRIGSDFAKYINAGQTSSALKNARAELEKNARANGNSAPVSREDAGNLWSSFKAVEKTRHRVTNVDPKYLKP